MKPLDKAAIALMFIVTLFFSVEKARADIVYDSCHNDQCDSHMIYEV